MKLQDTIDALRKSSLGDVLMRFRQDFVLVGLLSMIANLLMLTPTIYMLQVYDRVLVSRNELTLLVLTMLMVSFFGVIALAEWLRSRLLVRIGIRLDGMLGSLVFHAGFSEYLKNARLDTVRTFTDLTNIRQFLTGTGVTAFFDMPWTPVYVVVMFMLHPLIGWLGILFSLALGVTAWAGQAASARGIDAAADASLDAVTYVQSKLRNIEPLHAMGMILPLRERWIERYERALGAASAQHDHQQRQQSLTKFIRYSMQSLTLGAGALLVLNGEMSVGSMIAGNVLMSRALAPLDMMVSTWKQFVQAKGGFFRLEALLAGYTMPERVEQSQELQGRIRVENLSATAAEGRVPVLHGLNTSFQPGELVALIGPSGSGKSTFARSLLGIWPETTGTVLIDSIPVSLWDRSMIGPMSGYLPQDVELFDGTFAENIARFGDLDADRVIEAATMSGIHEMILRFPKGYDTQIGMGGSMLSGGQRQRVALARALYGNPSILVLDEPNANLDEAGERALNRALRARADAGKTVVVVTHRPSVLNLADRIMVMHEGHISLDGPRDDVMKTMIARKTASKPAEKTRL
ncbi:type I secretion system permease/ATPase [Prosthecochloris sp. ZM]|uniref:type I secretion system permease/ATPase n=1 Tax=Prosthecochloris sp. ZM TaxID=2283143 RepID=UPI000DF7D28B|nr:type I secretion system permease/ATPase [Prosthecochloris sp. ZM]RDD29279.1 type I secretion system permease/ATPase [Prosthecochloris sp. ZM]